MKKWLSFILIFLLSSVLFACTEDSTSTTANTSSSLTCSLGFHIENNECVLDDQETTDSIKEVSGILETNIIVGHYFNPLDGVLATSEEGVNLTSYVSIVGHVDYGTIGDYTLTYSLLYLEDSFSAERIIHVINGTYTQENLSRPVVTTGSNLLGSGSYFSGTNTSISHPASPSFIDHDLYDVAIPSSGWWTSLLVQNYGGSNGIYTNPLRVAYTNDGMEITNPEDGFVQYWFNEGLQTIAQFPLSLRDSYLKATSLNAGYETHVINYSDAAVQVALRNVGSSVDQMVTTLVQGSPYVFVEVANKESLTYKFDTNAVDNYEYYDVEGNLITSSTYTGNAIIVKLVHRHSGYVTTPPANVGMPQYSDKYYLVNTPDNTVFTITSANHPFGLKNELIINLGDSNYLSIAAINNLSEASFYHQNGYSLINSTDISYNINYDDSVVRTHYTYSASNLKDDSKVLIAMMPHHYKNSDASLTEYAYRTVRGTLKVHEGSYFETSLGFSGLLPGFTTPTDTAFDSSLATTYLNNLNDNIDTMDSEDFINYDGPYWNSKAMYPLSQGMIIADQLGLETLKQEFIGKLEFVLEDWFTYSGSTDTKFLYYNNTWGSVYYSNDDFATASTLSDHSFTHGYLIYAASVLAMYDPSFVDNYGDMVDLLLNDYMFTEKDSAEFAYLRNFDPFAGHSWAHGFGTFAEGNNLESSSEALNSWNAGYLWALATGDTERMEAAIYGFVTELSAAKEYWFDYDDTNWDPAYGDYVDVAGMVWGGKFDYATWFGANPTFIYGIQWLPTGEYLTSYALTEEELTKLSSIFETYLAAKNGVIDTWYSNMWAVMAIVDPIEAVSEFDASKILNDDYPNELVGSYWMVHSLASLGNRTSEVWMKLNTSVSSTVYVDADGIYTAMVWNPTQSAHTIEFYNQEGLLMTYTIQANTFESVVLN
ncbi:MAG: glycosyl hydrolase [Candidatus Izemoplasmatales bacterium]